MYLPKCFCSLTSKELWYCHTLRHFCHLTFIWKCQKMAWNGGSNSAHANSNFWYFWTPLMYKFLNVHTFINFHIFGKHLISSPNIRENTSRHGGLWYCVLVTTRHQTSVDSKYLVTTQTSNAMWLEDILTTHTRKT